MDKAIEFRNVWKSFKRGENVDSLRDLIPLMMNKFRPGSKRRTRREAFWALKDLSFEIKQGESIGLIGPNGSGKTTTLKLLCGILRQTKGDIFKRGRIGALIEVGAGFHGDLTGRENIYLNGSIMGMKKREIDKKVDEIVAFAEVEDFIETPVKRFSSGMYIRLGFSVAAHLEPDILLIDEVLAVGDLQFQKKCIGKIREIMENGCTMIFVSHNMGTVESVCERSLLLHHGEIIQDGVSNQVINRYLRMMSEKLEVYHEASPVHDNQLANIISLTLLNENGKIVQEPRSGEPMTIRFTYHIFKKINNPTLSFVICTEDGTIVFETKTRRDDFKISGAVGLSSVDFQIEELSLARGKYHLLTSMSDESDTVIYDFKNNLCFFEVIDSSRRLGIVFLRAFWKNVNA
jgi:ABC-type polysaccharide/polyol phosphate transport system ATPase subunit